MEQVSGRAGRKKAQGKVMIQALNVKHPIIQLVQQHDYQKFYQAEMAGRKEFFYPPFSRMIMLTLSHKDKETVVAAANGLAQSLKQDFKQYVVGPAAPVIGRVRNQYLMEIMLKLPKEKGMQYKRVVQHHINLLRADKKFKSIHIIADVDPI